MTVIAAGSGGCGSTSRAPLGGGWEIVTEISPIPEAGDHQSFLHRHSERVNVRVAAPRNYRFIPPDSVLWIGGDDDALWIASGDHQPLLLQGGSRSWEKMPEGDLLDLGALGQYRLTDLAARAAKQPLLTSGWKRPRYTYPNYPPSPTTLPN